ncbi:MAG: DUF1186 domain-containing protein [Verrucomicrobia bacterium]|nr:DUF1186 domain-containing protein [Verrucomicrobiota bacterium]
MSATPDDLLAALAYHDDCPFPHATMKEIVRRKDEMIVPLLGVLEACFDTPDEFIEGDNVLLPTYATYLLAQFREPRAFPLLLALLQHPTAQFNEIWSDFLTDNMGNLLASVYDGNEPLLRDLLENPKADEDVRSMAAIDAYLTLLSSGRIAVDDLEQYFGELLEHQLERTPSLVWDRIATVAGDLGLVKLLPQVRRAYAEDLCDPSYESLKNIENSARDGGDLNWNANCRLIEDAISEMRDWHCFAPPRQRTSPHFVPPPMPRYPLTPIRVTVPVTGRNEPCPCGSGKKFKKCCGNEAVIMARRAVLLAEPLRVRVSLCGTDPEVWREVLVPGRYSLLDLHRVIQAVMPWDGDHLHRFAHAGKSYYAKQEWSHSRDDGMEHAKLLHDLTPGEELSYIYDFGDNWWHDVRISKVQEVAADLRLPHCLGGENACPPDDIGGTGGYYQALRTLQDPQAEAHDYFVQWFGKDFAPGAFDPVEANERLRCLR